MILHVTKQGDVVATLHENHPWSPAEHVILIEVGKDNRACLSASQVDALKKSVDQCVLRLAHRQQLERMNPCPGCGESRIC